MIATAFFRHTSTRVPSLSTAVVLACLAGLAATPGSAAELVMFERSGCSWCARFDREVAPGYERSEEGRRLPLRRHNLDGGQPRDLTLDIPVRFTPTFVLIEDGREKGRITGYMDNATFWGLLTRMIERLGAAPKPVPPGGATRENAG